MCHVKCDQQEKSITKIQINRAKTFTKLILNSSQHLSRFIHFLLLTFTSFFPLCGGFIYLHWQKKN